MSSKDGNNEVTKAQLTDAFRSLSGGASRISKAAAPASPSMVAIAVAVSVGAIFVVGYLRGRRRSSIIEIKRL